MSTEKDVVEMTWSSGSIDEARKVTRFLVQEGHVASAQIVPWVETISLLDGNLETEQETRVVMLTKESEVEAVKSVIEENTTYELPVITWTHIDGANKDSVEWVNQSVTEVSSKK
ncbi:MAG: divalent-cation tolerance protein CutA [Waddliaceae bacterium]|nr:divalent-cation tolerance protein CutA [Waddliaceae bacterium]